MKKHLLAACIAAVLPMTEVSAAPVRQTIDVSVTVPAVTFYVKPQLGWPQSPIQLTYDPIAKSFDTYKLALQVKDTGKNITAELAFDPILTEDNSSQTLALAVSIAGRKLGQTPVPIHTMDPNEKVYQLEITSEDNAPKVGNYLGSVSLVFDEQDPPPPKS
ncbi:CS1 type fimbrial major subunit [Pinirhizobacter soli]|uniref:CS1 type fimbrial major subunit n=1 Tax=Pinirhizobacter soli TaxID=2786953 RepID=UPI00202A5573|nr:CS1 type fimbrial major subunit [Pinirhizobacter soli]